MKTLVLNGKNYEVVSVDDDLGEDELLKLSIKITGEQLKGLIDHQEFEIIPTDTYRVSISIYNQETYGVYFIYNFTDPHRPFFEGHDDEYLGDYNSFSLEYK